MGVYRYIYKGTAANHTLILRSTKAIVIGWCPYLNAPLYLLLGKVPREHRQSCRLWIARFQEKIVKRVTEIPNVCAASMQKPEERLSSRQNRLHRSHHRRRSRHLQSHQRSHLRHRNRNRRYQCLHHSHSHPDWCSRCWYRSYLESQA